MKVTIRAALLVFLMALTGRSAFAHLDHLFGSEQYCSVALGSAEFQAHCNFSKTAPYLIFRIAVMDYIDGDPWFFSGAVNLGRGQGSIVTSDGRIVSEGAVTVRATGVAPSGFGAGSIIRWSGQEAAIIRVLENAAVLPPEN